MIFRGDTELFLPTMQCVGCYLEHEEEILLLQKREDHPHYPGKWGVVAGKVDFQEPPRAAVVREIWEETGQEAMVEHLRKIDMLRVIHPHIRFFYHLFHLRFSGTRPQIRLSPEHCRSQWAAPRQAVELDLIEDEAEVISLYYGLNAIKART